MSNNFKSVLLLLITIFYFLTSSLLPLTAIAAPIPPKPTPTAAPTTSSSSWYNQGFTDWYAKVYDTKNPSEIFGERYTAAQTQWILYSLFSFPINFLGSKVQGATSCVLAGASAGTNLLADAQCLQQSMDIIKGIFDTLQISTNLTYSNNQEKMGLSESIYYDYQNRPISGIKYTLNTLSKFMSVPQANAQGFGYGAVDGLQQYWQGFRDIAYALTVLVVIVFSFMIMFRVKLSPQLVISVQSALPKVVTALVLATFSYAIAGFVIDLSYVVGGLFASLMELAGFANSFKEAFDVIVPIGGTALVGGFYILIWMFFYTIAFFLAAVWSIIGAVGGLSLFAGLATVLAILVSIWVLILMLWYTIKVPWVLLKTLISLLISIVVAPVQIVIGAIVPSVGFGTWFKKIIAETLVFPLTGLFMFLAWQTLSASFAASWGQLWEFTGLMGKTSLWAPPILGSSADMAGLLWLAVSFVFITMIPKATEILKMLIMGEKFAFGTAIGEAMGPLKTGWNYMGGDIIRKSAEFEGLGRTAKILQYLGDRTWMPEKVRTPIGKAGKSLENASKDRNLAAAE